MDRRRMLMSGSDSNEIINNYLTFIALEDDFYIVFNKTGLEYCIDGDGNWKTMDYSKATPYPGITAGQTISVRGNLTNNTSINGVRSGIGTFGTNSKKFELCGNCMSLLFKDNASNQDSLEGYEYVFDSLFESSYVVKIHSNLLPATTLAQYCYQGMFRNCKSLTTIPSDLLPATVLTKTGSYAYGCYKGMFFGCTSLTTIPSDLLPATSLIFNCYQEMFSGCTNLTTVPSLPSTSLAGNCYQGMFRNCKSLTTIPSDLLPATGLAESCYQEMFYGCTGLLSAPELPGTMLPINCYAEMFRNCINLSFIKLLASNIQKTYGYDSIAENYLYEWVNGVAVYGDFIMNTDININTSNFLTRGNNGIPNGWNLYDTNGNLIETGNSGSGGSSTIGNLNIELLDYWGQDTTNSYMTVPSGYIGYYSTNSDLNNTTAKMRVTVNNTSGSTQYVTFYIRSNGESNYDYLMVGAVDYANLTYSTSYSSSYVEYHTRGDATSGESLSDYTEVTMAMPTGEHFFDIVYIKDVSMADGTDTGYVLFPLS